MIPFELKIFSYIYECGRILTLILSAAWFFYALLLMIRLNRRFWLWLLIWPCIIGPMQIGFTWCGFHYRMELYDRFARTPQGWHNINVMPQETRAEYEKHDCHPRARDVFGGIAVCILILPFLYLCGWIGWGIIASIKTCQKRGGEPSHTGIGRRIIGRYSPHREKQSGIDDEPFPHR